jgi:hypothetical protein
MLHRDKRNNNDKRAFPLRAILLIRLRAIVEDRIRVNDEMVINIGYIYSRILCSVLAFRAQRESSYCQTHDPN